MGGLVVLDLPGGCTGPTSASGEVNTATFESSVLSNLLGTGDGAKPVSEPGTVSFPSARSDDLKSGSA